MRRLAALALLAALVLAPACASVDRPEGLVERWLLALNQGAAGRPGRYADPRVSERVLPGWRGRDPGALDVIEVGRGSANGATYLVPVRVVRLDGTAFRGTATVAGGRVLDVVPRTGPPRFPSEGGPEIGSAGPRAWLAAGATALLLIVAAALTMRLTPAGERGA